MTLADRRLSAIMFTDVVGFTALGQANEELAKVLAHSGKGDEARKLLSEIEAEYSPNNMSPYEIALVRFTLGDVEDGFRWLKQAYVDHDRFLFIIARAYELKGLHSDPRYLALLEKTGLAGRVRD